VYNDAVLIIVHKTVNELFSVCVQRYSIDHSTHYSKRVVLVCVQRCSIDHST